MATTVAVVLGVFVTFEVGYFLKTFLWSVGSAFFRSRIHPLQSSSTYGIVTTRDIDFLLTHLTNGRFLRCMDFGRVDHFFRTCLSASSRRLRTKAVVAATVIRYRKPVYLFCVYRVDTRVVHWDTRSLYYRQDMTTVHDGFLRATAYIKLALTCCPREALEMAAQGWNGGLQNLTDDFESKLAVEMLNGAYEKTPSDIEVNGVAITNGEAETKEEIDSEEIVDIKEMEDDSTKKTENMNGYEDSSDVKEQGNHTEISVTETDLSVKTPPDVFSQFQHRPLPPDLQTFIRYNELSSERVRVQTKLKRT